jgi:hypothetical protein
MENIPTSCPSIGQRWRIFRISDVLFPSTASAYAENVENRYRGTAFTIVEK